MLLLFAFAAAPVLSPPIAAPPRPQTQARVTLRIERAGTASADRWDQALPKHRKQIVRRDERGTLIMLRIVDFE